jgi:hypothetical protein
MRTELELENCVRILEILSGGGNPDMAAIIERTIDQFVDLQRDPKSKISDLRSLGQLCVGLPEAVSTCVAKKIRDLTHEEWSTRDIR